jgi:hypothetical protein
MGEDLSNDYKEIKSKISAYKTTVESKKNQKLLEREASQDGYTPSKSEVLKTLEDFGANTNKSQKQVKSQFDELIDIFNFSTPQTGNAGIDELLSYFVKAAINTKGRISEILVSETISAIGCSQEQEFVPTKVYVKVTQIDLFKQLLENPDDEIATLLYEKDVTPVTTQPYSMNRELYNRLQKLGVSFNDEYGSSYIGGSGNQIFDIKYVQQDNIGNQGDFFEVTLNSRQNNLNRISDFLVDYYSSLNLVDFDVLFAKIMNRLTNMIDFSLKTPKDQLEIDGYFARIIQRMLGLCTDNKEIDVAGTAKLSDYDFIDESFYELSPQDLRIIESEIENIVNGVIEFEDCGNVKFPTNVEGTKNLINKVRDANSDTEKAELVQESLDELSKDPNWLLQYPAGLSINLAIKTEFLKELPRQILATLLSPKIILAIISMVKVLGSTIADAIEDIKTFLLNFKKFIIGVIRRIQAIYTEELFKLIRRNIRRLTDTILLEIAVEAKDKRLKMIATISYILLQTFSAVIDYRRCKSVVDELLRLLNLGLRQLNLQIPSFALFSAGLLGGVSDTRAFANVIENLQKSGLPTGDLPDGSPNVMNNAFFNMIKGMNQEQSENGKTEIWIPSLNVASVPPGKTFPVRAYGKSY